MDLNNFVKAIDPNITGSSSFAELVDLNQSVKVLATSYHVKLFRGACGSKFRFPAQTAVHLEVKLFRGAC